MQDMINSGLVWHMEGTMGRNASDLLEQGACMLPTVPRKDYWGNTVPARTMLKAGTKGTYQNCINYWETQI